MEEVPEKCPICGGTMNSGYEWISVDECVCSKCYEEIDKDFED